MKRTSIDGIDDIGRNMPRRPTAGAGGEGPARRRPRRGRPAEFPEEFMRQPRGEPSPDEEEDGEEDEKLPKKDRLLPLNSSVKAVIHLDYLEFRKPPEET